MASYLDLRRNFQEAVIEYSETRRLRSYRSLDELEILFESVIEAARDLISCEAELATREPVIHEDHPCPE
jgi:hypothetical protein